MPFNAIQHHRWLDYQNKSAKAYSDQVWISTQREGPDQEV